MKRKNIKNTSQSRSKSRSRSASPSKIKSKYTLIPAQLAESDTPITQPTPDHPPYEDMICEVLANNVANGHGVTKQTILNRIKKNYKVQDRYAKPAIKSALKKMRGKRKVKRTIDGLYKRSRPRKISRNKGTSMKSRSLNTSGGFSIKSQEWTSETGTGMITDQVDSDDNENNSTVRSENATFGPKLIQSNYFLHENWPNKAEVLKPHLAKTKNEIRQILLNEDSVMKSNASNENSDVENTVIGLNRDELIFKIMSNFPSNSKTSFSTRKDQIETALKDMMKGGEVIRCVDSGLLLLERKINKKLSVANMNAFLNGFRSKKISKNQSMSKKDLFYKSLEHFKNSNFNEVQVIFNASFRDFIENTDEDRKSGTLGSNNSDSDCFNCIAGLATKNTGWCWIGVRLDIWASGLLGFWASGLLGI